MEEAARLKQEVKFVEVIGQTAAAKETEEALSDGWSLLNCTPVAGFNRVTYFLVFTRWADGDNQEPKARSRKRTQAK